jgi:hypothetical protein
MATDAFTRLLDQQPTEKERERLHNLRHELHLPADDPVWALLGVLEDFCQKLHDRTTRSPGCRFSAAIPSLRIIVALASGAALATGLMSVAFWVGFRAASPSQGIANCEGIIPERSWVSTTLSTPAGWIVVAQSLPLLVYVAYCGWMVRQRDSVVGWTLVAAALSVAALAGAGLYYVLNL